MTLKEFFSLKYNKYLWLNLLAMALVIVGGIWGVLKSIDHYTRHGEAVVVPDVKGMSVSEAEMLLHNRGLECVVSDSSYMKNLPAGCILEYTPSVGQKVKEGRVIYLTINTLGIPLQSVPDVADNSSLRQAEARLLAVGFKIEEIEYMEGERDWVYSVKYKGRPLAIGEKVPMGASLILVVGDGGQLALNADSLNLGVEDSTDTDSRTNSSAADESWF